MSEEELEKIKGYSSIISVIDNKDYPLQELKLPQFVNKDGTKTKYDLILKINTNLFFDFYDVVREVQTMHQNILFVAPKKLGFYPRSTQTSSIEDIILDSCVFEFSLEISHNKDSFNLSITNCFFKDQLFLRDQSLHGFNSYSTYYHTLKFYNCDLLSRFNIHTCEFQELDIDSSKICETMDFYGCSFLEAPFLNSLKHAVFPGNITFNKSDFLNGIDINNVGLDLQYIVFFRSRFNISSGSTKYPSSIVQIRLSANKLKKQLRKTDNIIDANQFGKLELEAFRLDPNNDGTWWDHKILLLNYWSNQHGTNPGYALGFIGLVTIVFSLLLCIPIAGQLHWDIVKGIGPTVNHFFKVLMITNWKFDPYDIFSFWTLPILFVGRVFIGYGIYQFIAAFRKYAKN
jgi:uncharacterized protein YjbI with pentapeptide repeats